MPYPNTSTLSPRATRIRRQKPRRINASCLYRVICQLSLSSCTKVGDRATRLMTQPSPNTLQAALGYTFHQPQLLVKALTHSSLAYEQTLEGRQAEGSNALREEENGQLAIPRDADLGLAVAA